MTGMEDQRWHRIDHWAGDDAMHGSSAQDIEPDDAPTCGNAAMAIVVLSGVVTLGLWAVAITYLAQKWLG